MCGTGVSSVMVVTTRPELSSPRTADSRPAPGPLIVTSTSLNPSNMAVLAASWAARVAANAEDLRDPTNPALPADAQEMTFPPGSVMVTMVLLNVAFTCTIPAGTFLATRFLVLPGLFFVVGFVAVVCLAKVKFSLSYFFATAAFLPATVFFLPLRVLELVRVRWPLTGSPMRWRVPL